MSDEEKPKVSLSEPDAPLEDDELVNIDDFVEEAEAELTEEEELRAENVDLKDRLMRSLAEQENLRKRAAKERIEAEQRGGRRLARDVLSVYDNMKRAVETVEDSQRESASALIEGIELTMRELINTFEKHQIEPIAPKEGDKFDPQIHEAMFEAAVPGTTKGNIIQVMADGFTIAGSMIRPAQVGVSSGG